MVSTIYTILGGIEAVIWTDVIQVFIMVGGTVFGIIYALVNVDAGAFAAMSQAAEAGKTQVFDFNFTLTTATVWVLIVSLPAAANNYVSNQTIVQRFISTKDSKEAARSMWVTALVGPAIMGLLGGRLAGIFILGTMTRRTHTVGVIIGFVVSIFVLYYTKIYTDLHFFLYGAVGMGSCVVVGYFSSLVIPMRQKSLEGLTIHTTAM